MSFISNHDSPPAAGLAAGRRCPMHWLCGGPAYPAYGTEVVAGDVYAPMAPPADQRGDPGGSLAGLCLDRRLLGLGRRTLQLASRSLGHAATSRLRLA
jgi:hypothetical protein